MIKDIKDQGRRSAECGWHVTQNPYPRGGSAYSAWNDGWLSAEGKTLSQNALALLNKVVKK